MEIGIASIWLGLESPGSNYSKLDGADTLKLTRELREHGIMLLGSTIIGLEHHTPANIDEEIEHAVAHETDLHQFMLYTPVPGTPLYYEMLEQGRLLDVDLADIHGQHAFNFRHAAISREQSTRSLAHAFQRDFERNGPSLFRICRTTFAGWMRYKNHPDRRVRERFQPRRARCCGTPGSAMLQGMEYRLQSSNPRNRAADSRGAERNAARVWPDRNRRREAAGPCSLVDEPARREAAGRRPHLRAGDRHRPAQLAGGRRGRGPPRPALTPRESECPMESGSF